MVSAAVADPAPLLEVNDVSVDFRTHDGWLNVVKDVSFSIDRGETVGLVGESGSGKTVTAHAILGLVRAHGGRISNGSVVFRGRTLTELPTRELRQVRGSGVGMIFQQASRSLNPAFTVGEQIAEGIRRHRKVTRRQAWSEAVDMLDRVGIVDASRRARQYPHQFSGGMCQRVMIASALALKPDLLIADEPTTAVDVTVQATILDLLRDLQADTGVAILFISHDLGVIAELCSRVVVMYAGQAVEQGSTVDLFAHPRHPYTEGLLGSVPRRGVGRRLRSIPGNIPQSTAVPVGCRFHPRCDHFEVGRCDAGVPPMETVGEGRMVRCVRNHELDLDGVLAR